MRGDGFVFRRGRRWWVGYYVGGKLHREPGGPTKNGAKDKLKTIRRELLAGTYMEPDQRRATVGDLLDDLLLHFETAGHRSGAKAESHVKVLRKALGHVPASALTTAAVERYQKQRLEAGRARATVNRECELLRQAFRRAYNVKPRRVAEIPMIPLFKLQNARQGFLSPADFNALIAHVGDADVRDFLEWFWWTGMRPSEIRQLTWTMFDQTAWTLTLDPKAAKIGRGRVLALEGPLRTIIDRRLVARRLDCVLIFHRTSKGKPSQPVKDYRRLWHAAVKAAKLPPGLLPYDLRRSAVRNLIRAGVHETVAMKISGHRTRSTFDRYNIGSVEDVRDAVTKVAAYVEAQPKQRNVVDLVQSQNDHNRPASQKTTPATSMPWLAEAGGNRTHRSGGQPGAGRL